MGAITNVIRGDDGEVEPSLLHDMAGALPLSGNDRAQLWREGTAALASASRADIHHQSTAQEADIAICFDGRLDNRAQLLDLLGDNGRTLRSAPDTHVALAPFGCDHHAPG